MKSENFRLMVASNVAKGQKTRAMLVDFFQGAPANMRHRLVGETFDPERSEALAFIKSRLQGDSRAVAKEAQRLFNLAKEHRVIRFAAGTWNAHLGPQINSRFGNAPVLKSRTWAKR
jgi:hypothetical protein